LSEERLKAYEELGRLAKKWRNECALPQDGVADLIFHTKASIIKLENARRQRYNTVEGLVNDMLQCKELGIRTEDKDKARELLKQVKEELGGGETGRIRQIKGLIDDVDDLRAKIEDLAEFIKSRELVFTLTESDTKAERSAKTRLSDALESYRMIVGRPEFKTFHQAAERVIMNFEAEMRELSLGTQRFRQHSRTRLDEAWESIIDEAKEPGDIVFATSVVPLEWWERNRPYRERNRAAIARGVQLVRIFIMGRDDMETIDLGDKEPAKALTPNKAWQDEMAQQAKMGVQVNWVLREALERPPLDILCACVSVGGDLHVIDNTNKIITDMEIVGVQTLPEGSVQWSELTKSTNVSMRNDVTDRLNECYRKSVRFAYLNWYRDFYDESYLLIDNEGARRETEAEIQLIGDLLKQIKGQPPSGTIKLLDLGCGYGRLAKPLAEADKRFHIWGIDTSTDMLQEAKKRTPSSLQDQLHYADVDMINLGEYLKRKKMKERFDAAICMYSSFGYMADKDNFTVLRTIATSLEPGGFFLLDLDDKDYFIRNQGGPKPYTEGTRGEIVWKTFRYDKYDDKTKRRQTQYMVQENGRIKPKPLFITRLYDVDELRLLLESAGLEMEHCWGSFSMGTYIPGQSERMVILARRT
jgi:SAM-dependent methyltransferase